MNILVCTDGSSYSEICCEYAGWLATRQPTSVDVLYVTDLRQYEMPMMADLSGSIGAQPYQNLVGQLQEIESLKRDAIEQSARKGFELAGFAGPLGFIHREGTLVEQVQDLEEHYDLVLLGKRGMGAENAVEHLGSNMERVVRASKKPCLVTSRSFQAIDTMVFAYDGGPSCHKALEFLSRSTLFAGVPIHVVCVQEQADDDTQAKVDEAVRILTDSDYEATGTVLQGEVEDAIATYATEHNARMLIMGAYGHSRIRHLFVGSTTVDLLRTRNLPVLCFR